MPPIKKRPLIKPTPTLTKPEEDDKSLENVTCLTRGCGKLATLQCPVCKNIKAPIASFCSQECFKSNWPIHSQSHTNFLKAKDFVPPKFAYTGSLRPAYVSPRVSPPKVPLPDYAVTGFPKSEERSKYKHVIPVYNEEEIAGIRAACRLTREALDHVAHMIAPGVLPDDIDKEIHHFIISHNAYPSPLNYHGFPKSICISVNEVVCHGIPDFRPLQANDIVNLDVSVYLNGYHGDLNETYIVGSEVDESARRLIKAAHDSMFAAMELVKPGCMFRDFGEVITEVCKKEGFEVARAYCGHGIGSLFHCAPNIPHYARNKAVGVCKPGMIFTIEPMVNEGTWEETTWADDWTSVTLDGKRSAQFEHTMLVTEDGYELLTARLPTSKKFFWEEEQTEAKDTNISI